MKMRKKRLINSIIRIAIIWGILGNISLPGYNQALDGMEFSTQGEWVINAFLASNGGDWGAAQAAWEAERNDWLRSQGLVDSSQNNQQQGDQPMTAAQAGEGAYGRGMDLYLSQHPGADPASPEAQAYATAAATQAYMQYAEAHPESVPWVQDEHGTWINLDSIAHSIRVAAVENGALTNPAAAYVTDANGNQIHIQEYSVHVQNQIAAVYQQGGFPLSVAMDILNNSEGLAPEQIGLEIFNTAEYRTAFEVATETELPQAINISVRFDAFGEVQITQLTAQQVLARGYSVETVADVFGYGVETITTDNGTQQVFTVESDGMVFAVDTSGMPMGIFDGDQFVSFAPSPTMTASPTVAMAVGPSAFAGASGVNINCAVEVIRELSREYYYNLPTFDEPFQYYDDVPSDEQIYDTIVSLSGIEPDVGTLVPLHIVFAALGQFDVPVYLQIGMAATDLPDGFRGAALLSEHFETVEVNDGVISPLNDTANITADIQDSWSGAVIGLRTDAYEPIVGNAIIEPETIIGANVYGRWDPVPLESSISFQVMGYVDAQSVWGYAETSAMGQPVQFPIIVPVGAVEVNDLPVGPDGQAPAVLEPNATVNAGSTYSALIGGVWTDIEINTSVEMTVLGPADDGEVFAMISSPIYGNTQIIVNSQNVTMDEGTIPAQFPAIGSLTIEGPIATHHIRPDGLVERDGEIVDPAGGAYTSVEFSPFGFVAITDAGTPEVFVYTVDGQLISYGTLETARQTDPQSIAQATPFQPRTDALYSPATTPGISVNPYMEFRRNYVEYAPGEGSFTYTGAPIYFVDAHLGHSRSYYDYQPDLSSVLLDGAPSRAVAEHGSTYLHIVDSLNGPRLAISSIVDFNHISQSDVAFNSAMLSTIPYTLSLNDPGWGGAGWAERVMVINQSGEIDALYTLWSRDSRQTLDQYIDGDLPELQITVHAIDAQNSAYITFVDPATGDTEYGFLYLTPTEKIGIMQEYESMLALDPDTINPDLNALGSQLGTFPDAVVYSGVDMNAIGIVDEDTQVIPCGYDPDVELVGVIFVQGENVNFGYMRDTFFDSNSLPAAGSGSAGFAEYTFTGRENVQYIIGEPGTPYEYYSETPTAGETVSIVFQDAGNVMYFVTADGMMGTIELDRDVISVDSFTPNLDIPLFQGAEPDDINQYIEGFIRGNDRNLGEAFRDVALGTVRLLFIPVELAGAGMFWAAGQLRSAGTEVFGGEPYTEAYNGLANLIVFNAVGGDPAALAAELGLDTSDWNVTDWNNFNETVSQMSTLGIMRQGFTQSDDAAAKVGFFVAGSLTVYFDMMVIGGQFRMLTAAGVPAGALRVGQFAMGAHYFGGLAQGITSGQLSPDEIIFDLGTLFTGSALTGATTAGFNARDAMRQAQESGAFYVGARPMQAAWNAVRGSVARDTTLIVGTCILTEFFGVDPMLAGGFSSVSFPVVQRGATWAYLRLASNVQVQPTTVTLGSGETITVQDIIVTIGRLEVSRTRIAQTPDGEILVGGRFNISQGQGFDYVRGVVGEQVANILTEQYGVTSSAQGTMTMQAVPGTTQIEFMIRVSGTTTSGPAPVTQWTALPAGGSMPLISAPSTSGMLTAGDAIPIYNWPTYREVRAEALVPAFSLTGTSTGQVNIIPTYNSTEPPVQIVQGDGEYYPTGRVTPSGNPIYWNPVSRTEGPAEIMDDGQWGVIPYAGGVPPAIVEAMDFYMPDVTDPNVRNEVSRQLMNVLEQQGETSILYPNSPNYTELVYTDQWGNRRPIPMNLDTARLYLEAANSVLSLNNNPQYQTVAAGIVFSLDPLQAYMYGQMARRYAQFGENNQIVQGVGTVYSGGDPVAHAIQVITDGLNFDFLTDGQKHNLVTTGQVARTGDLRPNQFYPEIITFISETPFNSTTFTVAVNDGTVTPSFVTEGGVQLFSVSDANVQNVIGNMRFDQGFTGQQLLQYAQNLAPGTSLMMTGNGQLCFVQESPAVATSLNNMVRSNQAGINTLQVIDYGINQGEGPNGSGYIILGFPAGYVPLDAALNDPANRSARNSIHAQVYAQLRALSYGGMRVNLDRGNFLVNVEQDANGFRVTVVVIDTNRYTVSGNDYTEQMDALLFSISPNARSQGAGVNPSGITPIAEGVTPPWARPATDYSPTERRNFRTDIIFQPGIRTIDIGGAEGNFSTALTMVNPDAAEIVNLDPGLDRSLAGIAVVGGDHFITHVPASGESTGYPDGYFDSVTINYLNLDSSKPDQLAILRGVLGESYDILAPGGGIFIAVEEPLLAEDRANLLTSMGFQDVTIVEMPEYWPRTPYVSGDRSGHYLVIGYHP
ncbi:MAG: hypothetical protein JXD21_00210 [Candidatus Omnitrophica bacterium]|nr:hypothetical protein [Candidatus Omnitrophota bacterium]